VFSVLAGTSEGPQVTVYEVGVAEPLLPLEEPELDAVPLEELEPEEALELEPLEPDDALEPEDAPPVEPSPLEAPEAALLEEAPVPVEVLPVAPCAELVPVLPGPEGAVLLPQPTDTSAQTPKPTHRIRSPRIAPLPDCGLWSGSVPGSADRVQAVRRCSARRLKRSANQVSASRWGAGAARVCFHHPGFLSAGASSDS
jgi:hypothetical protein